MPVLVRWYLKTALVYFVASLVLGVVQASGGPFAFLSSSLTPVYYHLLLVGWITQLILGVAIWMFPKFSLAQPRGNEGFAWGAYFLLNLGLLIRVISEPVNALYPTATWGVFLVVSAVLQWLAGMLIVAIIWQRVKLK